VIVLNIGQFCISSVSVSLNLQSRIVENEYLSSKRRWWWWQSVTYH